MTRITVITVVRNDATGLERTLASIVGQDHPNRQLVVVDGGSTDGTLAIIHEHAREIDVWISELDEGTYHAMNKGLRLADGEWLLFMNAGDEFVARSSLSAAAAAVLPELDVIYSDWIYREEQSLARADVKRMNVRHQSVMYRRSLHDIHGLYLVGQGVTISDYLFFLSLEKRHWGYCPSPIAICDKAGASGKPKHFHQRMAAELIFGRRGRFAVAMILLLHPLYRFLKRFAGLAFKKSP